MRPICIAAMLACLLQAGISNHHKRKPHITMRNILSDDAVLTVEPIPPDVVRGRCSCECCENEPAGKSLYRHYNWRVLSEMKAK